MVNASRSARGLTFAAALSASLVGASLVGGCLDYANCGSWYVDEDGDGAFALRAVTCAPPSGATKTAPDVLDCDDAEASVFPGDQPDGLMSDGSTSCDGLDNNCDGLIDEDAPVVVWYPDADEDGYGVEEGAVQLSACEGTDGYATESGDCEDGDADVHPEGVETVCADDVDSDCDGVTDCAISGTMDEAALRALGWSEALGSGAGRSMDAGRDVDGDGLPEVLVGGADGAYTVGFEGRQVHTSMLNLGFEAGEGAGADVALLADLDADGLGELVVGGPEYDDPEGGTYGVNVGRAHLQRSGSVDGTLLVGEAKNEYVGGLLAGAQGLLAVGRSLSDTTWEINLLGTGALPAAGTTVAFGSGDLEVQATISAAVGSVAAPPSLSVAAAGSGWLVAVGQPGDDTDAFRVKVYSVSSDSSSTSCYIKNADDTTTLGSSVLLADVTGDGAVDLVVGDPGERTVYVFETASECVGELAPSDASFEIKLGPVVDFGGALGSVPDMNGDGIDDLLIGGADAAVLVLGSPDELEAYAILTGAGGFGASVTGADLDGDGFGDLVIGAPESGELTVLWGGP